MTRLRSHSLAGGNVLFTAAIYCALGIAGLQLAIPPGYATAVFPAAGFALASVLCGGNRQLPGIWIGSLGINLWVSSRYGVADGKSVMVALLIGAGATLQAWAASLLIRHKLKDKWELLDNERDIIWFLLIAGPFACMMSATLGNVALVLLHVISSSEVAFNWWNWWVGDVIGVMLFGPLSLMVCKRKSALWGGRLKSVAIPTLLANGVIVVAFLYVANAETDRLKRGIAMEGESLSSQLELVLSSQKEIASSIDNLMQSNPTIGFSDFEKFTRQELDAHPEIQALSWNQVVKEKDRKEVETEMGKELHDGNFRFTERDVSGRLVPANRRDDYVIVRHITPRDKNLKALGFDIDSNPVRSSAVRLSIQTAKPSVTAPIQLVQKNGDNGVGVLLLHPVYLNRMAGSDRQLLKIDMPYGFGVVVLRLQPMLSAMFDRRLSENLALRIEDREAPRETRILYGIGTYDQSRYGEFAWTKNILFNGRIWSLSIIPSAAYMADHHSSVAWIVLAAGLVLASFLQAMLLAMTGHAAHIRRKVLEQTETIRLENERTQALLQNASDGIHILDEDGNVVEASDSFCTMLGYTRQEVIGMNVTQWDAGFADDAEKLEAVRRQFGKPVRSEFETRHRRKDGSVFDVEVSGYPLKLNGQKLLFNSSRDISDRKQAEQQFRIAATAFDSHEGILVTDADANILRVNRSFTAITGYALEEAIGKNPRLLSSGRHDADFYAGMWEKINSEGVWEGEVWNRRKSGEVYPEHLTVSAIKDSTGRVTNYVALLTDITQSKAAAGKIEFLAFYDPLTKLPNRRLLIDRMRQSLASSARSGKNGALLFIDIDNFKNLNDTLGHETGDLLLQEVARRLTACIREGDTASRFGGDEFVVMLAELSDRPNDAAAQAESIGNKILASLGRPYELGVHPYRSTPSIGITLFNDHEHEIKDLLKQADLAMYQAKAAGRNTLRFFDPEMQENINHRTAIEQELGLALDNHQFQLYYQIQADSEGRVLGAEALIRWLHPERGLLSPDKFISVAEETGLIVPIGQWVLETACAQIKAWQQNPDARDLVLSVNVSARQFRQADFITQIRESVQRHAIDPSRLKLELTESMLLEHANDPVSIMNALNEMGVQFSLDDFGTGYSSLQYLKKLPLGQLKIDQSFVRDIAISEQDRSIVRTIIAMAGSMGLEVIAEGVETEEQKWQLLDKGCIHFQGYLFGKPMPIDQFELRLK